MSDLISRQDAKDVVDMELDAIDHVPEWVYDRLLTALDKVPSAQPEIIRCKDCKHWYNAPASDGYNSCEKDALIRHESFFCGHAELRGKEE